MTADTSWVLFGCRTAIAVEVGETIWRRGDELVALIDNLPDPPSQDWAPGVPIVGVDAGSTAFADSAIVVPQTTPGARQVVAEAARAAGFTRFPALVDPSVVYGRTVDLAPGVVALAGGIIGGLVTVDEFAFVNRGAAIAHHCRVGAYASLGPRCVLTGSVVVEPGAFVGAGAVVLPGVTIGTGATVGAGSVVLADVAPGTVVAGNPARLIRQRVGDQA